MERKTYSNRHSELEPHPLPTLCMFKGLIVNPSFLATIFFSLLHFLSPLHFLPHSPPSPPTLPSHTPHRQRTMPTWSPAPPQRGGSSGSGSPLSRAPSSPLSTRSSRMQSQSLSLHLLSPFFFSLLFLLSLSSSPLLSTPHSFMFSD